MILARLDSETTVTRADKPQGLSQDPARGKPWRLHRVVNCRVIVRLYERAPAILGVSRRNSACSTVYRTLECPTGYSCNAIFGCHVNNPPVNANRIPDVGLGVRWPFNTENLLTPPSLSPRTHAPGNTPVNLGTTAALVKP